MTRAIDFRPVVCQRLLSVLALSQAFSISFASGQSLSSPPAFCQSGDQFHEVWIKVVERSCLKCHQPDGEAADTRLVFQDSTLLSLESLSEAMRSNRAVFNELAATLTEQGNSLLLEKGTGALDHGGGVVLKPDSIERQLIQDYLSQLSERSPAIDLGDPLSADELRSIFDGVQMIDNQRLLRRVTLTLAARLPTDAERQAVASGGSDQLHQIIDSVMNEPAFYDRLLEGFNDVFLTLGYEGNGEDALSYDHFEHTRHWYQNHSLDHLPEEERQRARYRLADQYREALRKEPLELIRYIVSHDRPITELVTADYTLVSPYTARGYGVFEKLQSQFTNPDDPFEFITTQLPVLVGRDGTIQPSQKGHYPHAGILSMFQYLRRYPTTETNRNRLRARMVMQHFLGVDIMSVAPRVGDAAAIDAQYEIPTMQAAECVVCHRTIDPIAGLFQDYYNQEGHYGPRKEGWFQDMFVTGWEGTDLIALDVDRIPWLGRQIAADPRFSVAMTEHVYLILFGRKVSVAPNDIQDPNFAAQRRAYLAQRAMIQQAAERLSDSNFNLKTVFHALIDSEAYRADALESLDHAPDRLAELADLGVVRMLGPEQLERKIAAIFGKPWGRLHDEYAILYGGIDSKEVTERLSEPSGAIGAIQRIMANDVACKNVANDFALPAAERRLFPNIETDVRPGIGDEAYEQKIREAIVHLHQHLLGRDDAVDSIEVQLTYQLFAQVVAAGSEREQFEKTETYFCKSGPESGPRDPDPFYTLRAWRAVVTYLLRRQEFLYE